jgi:DNA helicase II / ATP-dependent DNA helicase PcrA
MPYALTNEQQAILAHTVHNHARVLAGPGTGKSATLVALMDHLLGADHPPRIKLLTFTRAATAELAKKVSDHPAAATQRPSTIHSFSISVLLQNPGTGNFPEPLRIADDWENGEIVHPTLAHRANIHVRRLDNLIREMASNWESLQPEVNPRVDPAERARFLGAWNEHRGIYGYVLLSELPYGLRHALSNHPDLEGLNYDLLIVDEYQDLNACDLEVLRLIAARGCFIIGAGDDDQSIYSFRRAAPEGIRRFPQDYPSCQQYPLSVTQRCGSRITAWALHVIEGDPARPEKLPRLTSAAGSPDGEVALLAFSNETAEAEGVASLVRNLVEREEVPPNEILILVRGNHNAAFSGPIEECLQHFGIPCSDPDAVNRMLAERSNRFVLETFRLLVNRSDSLAWAALLVLTPGIGDSLCNYVYERALANHTQFGATLLSAYETGFPGGPRSAPRARALIQSVTEWLDAHVVPDEQPEDGWGHFIVENAGNGIVPAPTADFTELLYALDALSESNQGFDRYLSQITPMGKDRALAESPGVRIMTMGGAKGLTVRATIIIGLEEGLVPRPDCDLGEERRFLYVGMTRAKEFLHCTWARRRTGPTARMGAPRVQIRRRCCSFLDGGPVASTDGDAYIATRWP